MIQQIKCRESHGDFVLQPEIQLFAAEAFLQLRERQRPLTVPGKYFSIEDNFAREAGELRR